MWDILSCAIKNLSRKRLRTFLTASSITVGVTMVVIVTMISETGTHLFNNELESLGLSGLSISTDTVSASGEYGITKEGLEAIRTTKNVDTAMPLMLEYSTTILRENQNSTLICGIDAGARQCISLTLKYGRMITRGDVSAGEFVCVVDEAMAREAYGRDNITGKTITLYINDSLQDFRIIGIAQAGSSLVQNLTSFIPCMVYIPYTTLQNMTGRSTFDQVAVRVRNAGTIQETENQIIDKLQRLTGLFDFFKAENLSLQRDRLGNLLEIVTVVLTIISGISLMVSGLGIMTIMLVSVNERMREIGIKKAIGASCRRIMWEFMAESVAISLVGSVVGIVMGTAITLIGSAVIGIRVSVNLADFLYLIGFSVVIGAIFGVYPAVKAARMKPVDALHNE